MHTRYWLLHLSIGDAPSRAVAYNIAKTQSRDGTGQDFLDQTGKFQNLRRSTVFFTEGFCSLFNASNKKFSNGGGLGEMLKFVTPDGGLRKTTQNNFCVFCKNNSSLRPF